MSDRVALVAVTGVVHKFVELVRRDCDCGGELKCTEWNLNTSGY